MLNLSLLEKLKPRGRGHVSRCPACAAVGGDTQGNHLWIREDGRYGCVCNPGPAGKSHRQEIYRLAGDKTPRERKPFVWALKVRRQAGI